MRNDPGPAARFDDLRHGTALVFPAVERELVATRVEDVCAVLDAVDRLTSQGCWAFGFVAYEAAPAFDPAFVVREPVPGLPLAWFGLCGAPSPAPVVAEHPARPPSPGPWTPGWDAERHRQGVDAVHASIAAGEVYQLNLTTHLTAPLTTTAPDHVESLYRDLAVSQRGAHNAYLDIGRFVVASASPELFVELRDDRVLMRPMKGTSARGRTTEEDRSSVRALLDSPKERAENVMIVDVVRNDLARIARTGSVTVPALLRAERFETVHQLTSDVAAHLRPGVGLTDVFRATFPSASVTGAPKARAIALISDLEDSPRGVYCGAVGYVAPPGEPVRARFNVAIRTVVVDRTTATASYGTGGGITWGSRPDAEYAELLAKARILDGRPQTFDLLETMRHDADVGIASLERHLARMADSASYFGFAFDPAAARTALAARTRGAGDARVRLLCSRSGRLDVEVGELPAPLGRPVVLSLDDHPIDSSEPWPHHKTTRRHPYTSRRERHPAADDVVLVNERGEITETSTATIAVRLDDTWWTPPFGDGCLPGVERARLVEAGSLRERVLRPHDLRGAQEVAVVSALRGWRAATLTDELPTG